MKKWLSLFLAAVMVLSLMPGAMALSFGKWDPAKLAEQAQERLKK